MHDVEEVIVLGREALKLCPVGHPDRLMSLSSLAAYLSDQYNQFGKSEDLDQAIVLGREALALCPCSHPNRSQISGNLRRMNVTRGS